MPLITFTTDLKNLPYGPDRPLGGFSGQPYIVSPDPEGQPGTAYTNEQFANFLDFYNSNKTTLDFPIRGGSITSDGLTGIFSTPAGTVDKNRIAAFLNDKQRGTIFLLKQQGLQLTNPNIQVPGALGIPSIIETTRIYNPKGITTLQQVSAQGTGVHITRHGTVPAFTNLFEGTYEDLVKKNNGENSNRLSVLTKAKLSSENPIYTPSLNSSLQYGVSSINTQILNYLGGPGSVYGIGTTIIRRATNTNTGKVYNTIAYTYDTLMQQVAPTGDNRAHPEVQDFRSAINKQAGVASLMTADYKGTDSPNGWWIPRRVGDPGATPLKSRIDYSVSPGGNNIDAVNYLGPISYNVDEDSPWTADPYDSIDIIKFAFECLSNDTPGDAIALVFRAFLTNFSDGHQAELASFKYLGRGETFRTYNGFDRSISFSFRIAAFSREEMKPLYTKLNHLISQLYPDYSSAETGQFMRGSIIKLTIGDYLYRVPGFLESVNISVDGNTSWEIALDKDPIPMGNPGVDANMAQLPQVIDVQCSFKPIHDILPRREKMKDTYVPLIANVTLGRGESTVAEDGTVTATPPKVFLDRKVTEIKPGFVNEELVGQLTKKQLEKSVGTFKPPTLGPEIEAKLKQYQKDSDAYQQQQITQLTQQFTKIINRPQ